MNLDQQSDKDRVRVKVRVRIEATVEVTDSGYLGKTATVQKHIERALTDTQRRTWFSRSGPAGELEQHKVKLSVESVLLEPM